MSGSGADDVLEGLGGGGGGGAEAPLGGTGEETEGDSAGGTFVSSVVKEADSDMRFGGGTAGGATTSTEVSDALGGAGTAAGGAGGATTSPEGGEAVSDALGGGGTFAGGAGGTGVDAGAADDLSFASSEEKDIPARARAFAALTDVLFLSGIKLASSFGFSPVTGVVRIDMRLLSCDKNAESFVIPRGMLIARGPSTCAVASDAGDCGGSGGALSDCDNVVVSCGVSTGCGVRTSADTESLVIADGSEEEAWAARHSGTSHCVCCVTVL